MADLHLDASIIDVESQEYPAEFSTPHYATVCDGLPRRQAVCVRLRHARGLGLTLNEAEIAACLSGVTGCAGRWR